jgi:acetylornithine deacetylase
MIDEKIRNLVFDEIEKQKGEMIAFLQKMVRTPSVTGFEKDAQQIMADTFASMGLKLDVFTADEVEGLKEHPGFFPTPAYGKYGYKNRPNVVGKWAGSGGGKSLILCGHIDVVPPDPVDAWTRDPWCGDIDDGKVHGRGAMDMKGGIAAMTYTLKSLQKAGIRLKGDLMLATTIEEEEGGTGGVLASILRGHTADAAIIVECHYREIHIASSGIANFRIKVLGKAAHAGRAHLGINAILKAWKVCQALVELNDERQERIHYSYVESIAPRSTNINIGTIEGGHSPSMIPNRVNLECQIRYPPNSQNLADVMQEVEARVEEAAAADAWLKENPPEVEWFGWKSRPHEQDIGHPFVQMLKRHAEDVQGCEVGFAGGTSANDARFFVNYANTPAVLFGPTGGNIHAIDEYVTIEELVGTAKTLALLILDWCGYE